MTTLEFIKARYGNNNIHINSINNVSLIELSELIDEFIEIAAHIKEESITLDNTKISADQWIAYNEKYKEWNNSINDISSMNLLISKPNKPNYFRANND